MCVRCCGSCVRCCAWAHMSVKWAKRPLRWKAKLNVRLSQLFVLNMEPAAVAALAAVVDHEHAQTMNSLVLQIEQLTRETQALAVQALQYRRETQWLRAVVAAALQDLRRNDLESAEGRLLQGDMWS